MLDCEFYCFGLKEFKVVVVDFVHSKRKISLTHLCLQLYRFIILSFPRLSCNFLISLLISRFSCHFFISSSDSYLFYIIFLFFFSFLPLSCHFRLFLLTPPSSLSFSPLPCHFCFFLSFPHLSYHFFIFLSFPLLPCHFSSFLSFPLLSCHSRVSGNLSLLPIRLVSS